MKKDLDTVKRMREIRDKISNENMDMSFEELMKYISNQTDKSKPVLKKMI